MMKLTHLLAGLIVAASLSAPALAANSWYDFSTSEPSNSTSGGVNTAENAAPSTINDAMRNWKQLEAGWLDDFGAVNTVGGTATAITVTLAQGFTAYGTGNGEIPNGAVVAIKASSAATGATTLNVNGIGTKAIRRQGDSAVSADDWLANAVLLLRYDSSYNSAAGAWVLLNNNDLAISGGTLSGAVTAPSFIPNSSSAPTNGIYLPATNTVGIAANSAGEVQVTGTATSPVASDGNALGTSSLMWSDLFLASGGVINLNNGDVTATHSTNTLTFAGASTGYVFNDGPVTLGAGQIGFPASQNASSGANVLDDYEELNDAAISQGSGIAATSGTITSASGQRSYVKIGKMVTVTFSFTITTLGTASGQLVLTLPFTSAAAGGRWVGFGMMGIGNGLIGSLDESVSTMTVRFMDDPMGGSGTTYLFSITYWV